MRQEYLTPEEASGRLRIAPQTLSNWRALRKGPPSVKIGGRVLYPVAQLESFLEGLSSRSEAGPESGEKEPVQDEDPEFSRYLNQLPRRAQTVLRNRNITSFAQLAALNTEDLKGIPNCGHRTIEKILGSGCGPAAGEKSRPPHPDRDLACLVKRYGLQQVLAWLASLAPP